MMWEKTFISGSRGYIGSNLYRLLCIDHDIEECDLKIGRDILSYEPIGKIDCVYHIAGQAGAVPSLEDPINDAKQNILGTIRAIQIANENKAKLIFSASAAAINPISPYGLSKKTAEDYIKLLCHNYVILRFSSVYGDKPVGVVDNFIREKYCTIFGDGSAVRDFVHVNDIAEALMKARNWEKGEYDCGSGKGTTILELAKATGKDIKFLEKRDGEIHESILKNTTPNWEPLIDVIEFIKDKCKK